MDEDQPAGGEDRQRESGDDGEAGARGAPAFSCCEAMVDHLSIWCGQHGRECPDRALLPTTVHPSGRRMLLAAANADYDFEFCPWCGTRVQEPDGLGTGTRRLRA